MSRALIVGAGLVGAFSARALDSEGCEVTLVDPEPDAGYVRRVAGQRCATVTMDASDSARFEAAVASIRPEVVVWAAGPSGGSSGADATELWNMNVVVPARVAEAACAGSARRLVYVSSFAVYGPAPGVACVAESDTPSPVSAYGRAKLAGERALTAMRRDGFEVRILRPCGLYGPVRPGTGSRSARFVAALIDAAMTRRSMTLPFSATDELLYAKDMGRAVALAALRSYDGDDPIFNVGIGRHVRTEDIVAALGEIAPGSVINPAPSAQHVAASIPPLDISKIRRAFGFAPEYDVDTALRDYLEEATVFA